MKLRFALLGLALALTGCPNPGPDTSDKKDPQASPTPGDQEPAIAISTLGLVSATIQDARYEVGQPRYRFYLSLGHLRAKGNEDSSLTKEYYKPHADGVAGHYTSSDASGYTHAYQAPPLATSGDGIGATLGGVAATSRRLDSYILEVGFPAGTTGDLELTRPQGTELLFRRTLYSNTSYTVFVPSYVIPENSLNSYAFHSATASLTVAIKELNGDPSPGLTASHFEVSAEGSRAEIKEAKETSKGIYQVVASFGQLSGQAASTRQLILTVVNPAIRQEVTP